MTKSNKNVIKCEDIKSSETKPAHSVHQRYGVGINEKVVTHYYSQLSWHCLVTALVHRRTTWPPEMPSIGSREQENGRGEQALFSTPSCP